MTTPPAPSGPLGPEQQQAIVERIGRGLAGLVPPGWRQLRVDYRAAGRHVECDVHVTTPDGAVRPVPAPPELLTDLADLRTGMYRPGAGTWLSAALTFDPARGAHTDYADDREPVWRRPPPPIGFQDELRFFPRADQHVPAWLRTRAGLPPAGGTAPAPGGVTPQSAPPPGPAVPSPGLGVPFPAGAGPAGAAVPPPDPAPAADPPHSAMPPESAEPPSGAEAPLPDLATPADGAELPSAAAPAGTRTPQPAPGIADPPAQTPADIKTPRIYDGLDDAGRPVVERERLGPEEREQVLAYLEAAPAVLASRSYGTDAFDPARTDVVPMVFRTDGSWAWPGAVAYYLREHDVPPDPELLSHLRGRRFAVPEVAEPAREIALAAITGESG